MNAKIDKAVKQAKAAAEAHADAVSRWYRAGRVAELPKINGADRVTVTIGDNVVEVKATVGGNTRAIHTTVTFKLNGKRTTSTVIEDLKE